jgi:hypothetical protein
MKFLHLHLFHKEVEFGNIEGRDDDIKGATTATKKTLPVTRYTASAKRIASQVVYT